MAAQYIRMSTDTQTHSPAIQKQAIADYALANEMTIVATYEDGGRSGLTLRRRQEMRRLLGDVTKDDCSFSVVLVYDVSRWGRFQDTDESAYYEYHCRMHGVAVIYVQESFTEHRTPMAALLKAAKRVMAAEFSRELAVKVSQGQQRALSMGFHIGRPPCIGIDRIGVSSNGEQRALAHLERHRKGEHVLWTSGPQDEVALVRRIFREYTKTAITLAGLANKLNAEGLTARGRDFTLTMIKAIIDCEIFHGFFVWGRRKSARRVEQRSAIDPAVVRVPVAFKPAVSQKMWADAQAKRKFRFHIFNRSKRQLLEELRAALQRRPDLTATELRANGCASIWKYREAFGSMREAMRIAGRDQSIMHAQYLRRKSRTHSLSKRFKWDLLELLNRSGFQPHAWGNNQLVRVASTLTLRYKLIWEREHRCGLRWHFQRTPFSDGDCDLVLLVLMRQDETANDMLLMKLAEYRELKKWFDLGDVAPELRMKSGEQLVAMLKSACESIVNERIGQPQST